MSKENDYQDFKITIIRLLEDGIPELRGKIQAGAVDSNTAVPFAAFTVPNEEPVRTKDGIAGYNVSFEVSVYAGKFSEAEQLRHKVIHALEGADLGLGQRSLYKGGNTDYFPDYDLHGAILTFKILLID